MTDQHDYRQRARAAERTASLHNILRRTPLGQRAYIWELLNEPFPVTFRFRYVEPGEVPPQTPIIRAPERLRIALGPINNGRPALDQDNLDAHLEALFEGEWQFGQPWTAK